MWQTHYNSSPHANFTFSFIAHINYHHPTYLGERGQFFYKNGSFPFEIFEKHGGDDGDLYQ
jgi:hypothetical protein